MPQSRMPDIRHSYGAEDSGELPRSLLAALEARRRTLVQATWITLVAVLALTAVSTLAAWIAHTRTTDLPYELDATADLLRTVWAVAVLAVAILGGLYVLWRRNADTAEDMARLRAAIRATTDDLAGLATAVHDNHDWVQGVIAQITAGVDEIADRSVNRIIDADKVHIEENAAQVIAAIQAGQCSGAADRERLGSQLGEHLRQLADRQQALLERVEAYRADLAQATDSASVRHEDSADRLIAAVQAALCGASTDRARVAGRLQETLREVTEIQRELLERVDRMETRMIESERARVPVRRAMTDNGQVEELSGDVLRGYMMGIQDKDREDRERGGEG